MPLSPTEEVAEAAKHLVKALAGLNIGKVAAESALRNADEATQKCAADHSAETEALKKEISGLQQALEEAVEALAQEKAQSSKALEEKTGAARACSPELFGEYLKNLSTEGFASAVSLSTMVDLQEALDSSFTNSNSYSKALKLPKVDQLTKSVFTQFPATSITFDMQDEVHSLATLQVEIKEQLAAADHKSFLNLLAADAASQAVKLSGRGYWFRLSLNKFLKIHGCEIYVEERQSHILVLPRGVLRWQEMPAGTLLLKQGGHGDELIVKLGGDGSEGSADGPPKLICVKTCWLLDIAKCKLGLCKGGDVQQGLDSFAKACGGKAGEVDMRKEIAMQFAKQSFALYNIPTVELPDRKSLIDHLLVYYYSSSYLC
jgi:hypothetical protein